MKKLLLVSLMFLATALVAVSLVPREAQEQTPSTANQETTGNSASETLAADHDHGAATARVPAYLKTAPAADTLPATLPPDIFTGNVRLAYQAAKEIPATLAQIPCYCHCDMSQGHKSLHSCFQDHHGENCGICIGEALMAHHLQRQGLKPAQIRERVIAAYGEGKN